MTKRGTSASREIAHDDRIVIDHGALYPYFFGLKVITGSRGSRENTRSSVIEIRRDRRFHPFGRHDLSSVRTFSLGRALAHFF